MIEKEPSRTALAVATYRAAHQVLEDGRIFRDDLALRILGLEPETLRANAEAHDAQSGMRFFVVARSVLTEGELSRGVEGRGVRQAVVLGAGLDTFAYRNPFKDRLRVFEVDHPATQIWKRRRLADTGIPIPESLVYVPVDFERESLSARLLEAGLDPEQRTFFIWLGVTPYLTKGAIVATLEQIAALPGGSEVAFDYGEPRDRIDPAHRPAHDALSARVAAVGEPFLSSFVPEDLHATLRAMGFDKIEDLDVPGIRQRLFSAPDGSPAEAGTNASPRAGGHLLFASKGAARPAGRGA